MLEKTERPALVIVDMQNDFVRQGAPLEVPDAREVLPRLTGILTLFRKAPLPVVHTRYIGSPNYAHLQDRLQWLRLLEPPINACRPEFRRYYTDIGEAREAVAIVDELAPLDNEIVIDKPYYSAFFQTDLQTQLEAAGVDGLLFAGTVTEMCVEDTARHAVHYGYHTALIGDAVASNNPTRQRATLEAFSGNYGHVVSCAEIEKKLSSPAGVVQRA
ncbi:MULTISPECIES: cysteine hydrolase family protein [Roseovarius]|uniref:cysteine hydrolase family protein n=1 Tax=Roseovarius TaxID=74030 RepID=UPI000CDD4AB6|nr:MULTISPECIES: isochorismatase family cysteine hydrolase [Roseovarius]